MNVKGFKINDVLWNGLRKCQQEALKVSFSYLKNKTDKSCLLSLPTGAGKTGVINVLAHKVTQDRTLVICHRRAVCDQLIEQLSGEFLNTVAKDQKITQKNIFGKLDSFERKGIYVSTFQKLQSMDDEDLKELQESIDVVIVDEGHSEPSPQWRQLIRGFHKHKIVLTATPYRNDLLQFNISPEFSYIYTFKECLEDDILVSPIFETIDKDQVINVLKDFITKNPKAICIVKCKTQLDIEAYYKLLDPEFTTLAVHDSIDINQRDNVRHSVPKNLKDLDYQVIIHQHKLDEGIDIPQAKLLLLTYEIGSGRELVQSIGRIVRKHLIEECLVCQLPDSINETLWDNYRTFDRNISVHSEREKFLKSLDTITVLNNYLDAFPENSYFGKQFRKMFDLNAFKPEKSLIIPKATVCFLKKLPDFTSKELLEELHWQAESKGDLVKTFHYKNLNIIISITFNTSGFLRDLMFFEPKLEVLIFSEIDEFVAIYDSQSRKFTNKFSLNLGEAVERERLFKLSSRNAIIKTREANSKSISTSRRRPNGISVRGVSLEDTANLQSNSSYRISTLKVANCNAKEEVQSSYYLGVDNGRVADQKERNLSLDELNSWLEDIAQVMKAKGSADSNFINSYSKPLKYSPNGQPELVILDFSDLDPIHITQNGNDYFIENTFHSFDPIKGLPLQNGETLEIELVYVAPQLMIKLANEIPCTTIKQEPKVDNLSSYLDKISVTALYKDGVCYSDGSFYRFQLPHKSKCDFESLGLNQVIFDMLDH